MLIDFPHGCQPSFHNIHGLFPIVDLSICLLDMHQVPSSLLLVFVLCLQLQLEVGYFPCPMLDIATHNSFFYEAH